MQPVMKALHNQDGFVMWVIRGKSTSLDREESLVCLFWKLGGSARLLEVFSPPQGCFLGMVEVGSPGRCVGCSDACQEQGWLPALLVGRKYRAEVLVTPFPDHSLCPGDGLGSDLPPVPLLTKGMFILALKAPVWAGSQSVRGLKGIK